MFPVTVKANEHTCVTQGLIRSSLGGRTINWNWVPLRYPFPDERNEMFPAPNWIGKMQRIVSCSSLARFPLNFVLDVSRSRLWDWLDCLSCSLAWGALPAGAASEPLLLSRSRRARFAAQRPTLVAFFSPFFHRDRFYYYLITTKALQSLWSIHPTCKLCHEVSHAMKKPNRWGLRVMKRSYGRGDGANVNFRMTLARASHHVAW